MGFFDKINKLSELIERENEKMKEKLVAAKEQAATEEEKTKAIEEAIDRRAREILADKRAEKELERKFAEIGVADVEVKVEQAPPLQEASASALYFQVIIDALQKKAGPAIIDVLADVDRLSELARGAYQALPMPVRFVLKEQSFVEWVVSHKDSVLEKVGSRVTARGDSVSTPIDLLLPADNQARVLGPENDQVTQIE